MGQQQLLLLVLGIVIVGLAVVAGISAFNENKQKATVDRYTASGVSMAGELIAWYMKPAAQGGAGSQASAFSSLTIDKLGYALTSTDTYAGAPRTGSSANGDVRYLVRNTTAPYFHIHPDPLPVGGVRVEVFVFGPHRECVTSRTNRYGIASTWSDGRADGQLPPNPDASRCSW